MAGLLTEPQALAKDIPDVLLKLPPRAKPPIQKDLQTCANHARMVQMKTLKLEIA